MVLYLSCKLQKVEFDLSKHGKVIKFFNRYFHLYYFLSQSWIITLVLSKKRKTILE